MPQIKRWHPISHDFNRDPQMIEARKRFGDWIGYAWQECLSIADRNDGVIPGTLDQIAAILAPISLQKYLGIAAKSARMFLEFAANLGWIQVETTNIRVVNYMKYHRSREPNRRPPNHPNLTYSPIVPLGDIKKQDRAAKRKTGWPEDFQVTDEHREWAQRKNYRSPDLLFEAFKDHHLKIGSTFSDWDAALRTWVRNDTEKFSKRGQQSLGGFVG